jgi:hypothetical protein
MKLTDWIEQNQLSLTEVGRRLGTSQGHISDLCAERFWPSREVFGKLWRLTSGAVTPNDFLSSEERGEA